MRKGKNQKTFAALMQLLILVASHTAPSQAAVSVIKDPQDLSATENSTVTLNCRTRPGADIRVIWNRDGVLVASSRLPSTDPRYSILSAPEEGIHDLQVIRLSMKDQGQYYCQVSEVNSRDSWPVISGKGNLRVLKKAEAVRLLLRSAADSREEELRDSHVMRVMEGEPVLLACQVGGSNPAAEVAWLFRGGAESIQVPSAGYGSAAGGPQQQQMQPDVQSRRDFYKPFKGSSWIERLDTMGKIWTVTAVLKIDSHSILDAHHGMRIECEATVEGFSERQRSPGVSLYVSVAPQVKVILEPSPQEGEFREHDNAIATCSAVGRPDTFVYSWAIDDIGPLPGKTESRLPLTLTRQHNDKQLRCWATNFARGEGSARLRVRYGPKFSAGLPQLYAASVGSSAVMSCEADGNPPAEIVWRRASATTSLTSPPTTSGDSSPAGALAAGPSLRLPDLRRRDFGQFVCTASVSGFAPISRIVILAENSPPRITTAAQQYAKMAHNHRLECRINSIPLPQPEGIVWLRNDRLLAMDARIRIYREDFMGGTTAIVHFDEVFSTDFGAYNCTVSNGFGTDSQIITLVIEDNIPVAFIAGASIALLMVVIFVLVLLCVCRKGYWETRAVMMREARSEWLVTPAST